MDIHISTSSSHTTHHLPQPPTMPSWEPPESPVTLFKSTPPTTMSQHLPQPLTCSLPPVAIHIPSSSTKPSPPTTMSQHLPQPPTSSQPPVDFHSPVTLFKPPTTTSQPPTNPPNVSLQPPLSSSSTQPRVTICHPPPASSLDTKRSGQVCVFNNMHTCTIHTCT